MSWVILGSCGGKCKNPNFRLYLCTTCKILFHHLCDGECRDQNTCKKCDATGAFPRDDDELESNLGESKLRLGSEKGSDSQFSASGVQVVGETEGGALGTTSTGGRGMNCEVFGSGCVIGFNKRVAGSFQTCNTCGKSFDVECKRAYAPACELEGECGCMDAKDAPQARSDSDFSPAPSFNVRIQT